MAVVYPSSSSPSLRILAFCFLNLLILISLACPLLFQECKLSDNSDITKQSYIFWFSNNLRGVTSPPFVRTLVLFTISHCFLACDVVLISWAVKYEIMEFNLGIVVKLIMRPLDKNIKDEVMQWPQLPLKEKRFSHWKLCTSVLTRLWLHVNPWDGLLT